MAEGFPGVYNGGETTGYLNIGAVQKEKSSTTEGFPGVFPGSETTGYLGLGGAQRDATPSGEMSGNTTLSLSASLITSQMSGSVTLSLSVSGTLAGDIPSTNLVFRVDASNSSYFTLDGDDRVEEWQDISANGNHAVQATALKRPYYMADDGLGRPCVVFPRFLDDHSNPSTHVTAPSGGTFAGLSMRDVTIYAVCGLSTHCKDQGLLFETTTGSNNPILLFYVNSAIPPRPPQIRFYGANTGTSNPKMFVPMNRTALACVGGASSVTAMVHDQTATGAAPTVLNPWGGVNIGGFGAVGLTYNFYGWVYEILIYSGQHDASTRTSIISTLETKWGVNIDYDGQLVIRSHSHGEGAYSHLNNHWPHYLNICQNNRLKTYNLSISGCEFITAGAGPANDDTIADVLRDPGYAERILLTDLGANDLFNGASGATTFGRLTTWTTARIVGGWTADEINVQTVLARSTAGSAGQLRTTDYNALVRPNTEPTVGHVIDSGLDAPTPTVFSLPSSPLNAVYYDSDLAHLTADVLPCGYDESAALFCTFFGSPPVITVEPVGQSFHAGDTFSLSVVATGDEPLTYQWRKGGIDIPGATSSELLFDPAVDGDAGFYDVVVTNNFGSDTSVEVELSLQSNPVECDPEVLISGNPCLSALSDWNLELVKTQLLCNIANFLESGEPVTCDIQTLLDDAVCFNALSPYTLATVQAQLLCNIVNFLNSGAAVTCDVQELLDDARCFNALSPRMLNVAHTQLLCDLSNAL